MVKTNHRNGDLLTRHQLAERLEMSTPTVDRWVRAGVIPVIHHPLGKGRGRKVWFSWPKVAKALKIPG